LDLQRAVNWTTAVDDAADALRAWREAWRRRVRRWLGCSRRVRGLAELDQAFTEVDAAFGRSHAEGLALLNRLELRQAIGASMFPARRFRVPAAVSLADCRRG
jgi:hypothetical protein